MGFIHKLFFHSIKRAGFVIFGLIIAITLPITLFQIQKSQDLRQRASVTTEKSSYLIQVNVTFDKSGSNLFTINSIEEIPQPERNAYFKKFKQEIEQNTKIKKISLEVKKYMRGFPLP